MSKLDVCKRICAALALLAATVIASPAQTVTTLHSFDGSDGANPEFPSLVQGFDGELYGTTSKGAGKGGGTVFKISTAGTLTTLHKFCTPSCMDARNPVGGVTLGTDGNLYGTAEFGGSGGAGTTFKMTPTRELTTYSLLGIGSHAASALIQATNGDFYGTASGDGAHAGGAVFRMSSDGTLAPVYFFCADARCPDGRNPFGGLVQGTDGNLYGTTIGGGAGFAGTVFKLSLEGQLVRLHSFDTTDGANPFAGLIQASDGNFYGTTLDGGANGAGTIFQITPAGTLTTLYSFCTQARCADGELPGAGLTQATDGNFYGTTQAGGANYGGTIFQITSGGTLTTLYNFCAQTNCADGGSPYAGLVQATDGNLYGSASLGGTNNVGTIFSLNVGLGPFVETLPTFSKERGIVTILGTNLTGATAVTFNGKNARFSVVSATEIDTSVPVGATTGFVTVTTPRSVLSSNVMFRVRPPHQRPQSMRRS